MEKTFLQTKKVMLVDDEPDLLKMVSAILADDGFENIVAAATVDVYKRQPDSQEICFVPDQDYAGFIEDYTGRKFPPGNFVTTDGKIIGRHAGIIHYTVGQRKGLGIAMGRPVFVTEIRPETNDCLLYTSRCV